MYYQNYEDYMRSVLGYNNGDNYSTYDNGYYPREVQVQDLDDMDDMYPDIYRIVYPVVCKVCDKNMNRQITHSAVDEMVEEIYNVVEGQNEVKVEIKAELKNGDVRNPNVKQKEEAIKETRQKNFLLNDLIRILLLRELLRRRPNRPGRPGGALGRPPFPIGPGMPPQGPGIGRPPMMPRDLYY